MKSVTSDLIMKLYLTDKGYDLDLIASTIVNKINATKKVSRKYEDVDGIKYVLSVIMKINHLDWTSTSCDDELLDNVMIPSCFSDFVFPSKVALVANSRYPDLRFDMGAYQSVSLDKSKLISIADDIYQLYKSEAQLKSVGELRKVVCLHDVNFAILLNNKWSVIDNGDAPFIPIPLKSEVSPIIGVHAVNESANYVIQTYFDYFKI